MTKGSRILLLVASLALGLAYVLPVWRINLEAPQYPEGLGMVIRINTIEGVKKNDLNNINNLNHYIGMKRIVPESIPELKLMPVIVGVLMLLGAVTAGVGRRKVLYAFTAVFLAVSLAGLVDFWKWEYDYGHDLDDENAIIKIPGMSYQPPLIGSRQILNFTAHSWPGAGGWIMILTGVTVTALAAAELRRGRKGGGSASSRAAAAAGPGGSAATTLAGVALLATLSASACGGPAPRPIAYGADACESCLMGLADEGHGTEVVTHTGKAYVFDSIECMVAWLRSVEDPESIHSLWVTDFSNPPDLVEADDAFFLVSPTLQSPMGLGLTAFARQEDRDGAVNAFGGSPLDFAGVRDLVAARWSGQGPAHGGHGETMTPPADAPAASPHQGHGG